MMKSLISILKSWISSQDSEFLSSRLKPGGWGGISGDKKLVKVAILNFRVKNENKWFITRKSGILRRAKSMIFDIENH